LGFEAFSQQEFQREESFDRVASLVLNQKYTPR